MSIIQNVTQKTPVVQVEGRVINQNAAKSQESLRSLETGERLSGKIISMTDEGGVKNAQIRLGDDTVISAKLQDGMYLKEGQTISFEVRGVSNQITLTPLYENTSVDSTTLKALNAAGIEVNQDTVNMVKSMMENGMGIDRDSLNSMHQLIGSHPEADVSSIVQMKALNIPITDENISQFESYKNYEHQVVETMKSIMDDLPGAYNQLVQSGEGKAANDLYGGILDMLAKGAEHMEKTAVQNEINGAQPQGEMVETGLLSGKTDSEAALAEGGAIKDVAVGPGAEGAVNNTEGGKTEILSTLAEGEAEGELLTEARADSQNTSGTATADKEQVLMEAAGKSSDIAGQEKVGEAASKEDVTGNASSADNDQRSAADSSGIKGSEQSIYDNQGQSLPKITLSNNLANIIRELNTSTGATGEEIQKLIEQARTGNPEKIDQMALLKELSEAYSKSAHTSEAADQAFSRLFSNNEYNKLMKNIMQDEWMIKPDEVRLKENIENLYARLNSQAKQLTSQLTAALGADNKVAQSAANLQNNIDFMNQLNQMFHYVQLPLKMADQDAHGDLYVYSNGKKKFEPGDEVSAILHLDMDNLGPIDVYVKMKDTNVKTNFYVADEEIIDLIHEHIGELNDRLNKRGYTMEARMMLHTDMDSDSEDPPVSSILESKKTAFLSMTTFDARA
ncbi:flagellar hook-length control protein FliK [Butyrivibrio sp. LC3010]|uniref:flagellar hook-length control protein FliK n=1 Tax=Butyrivibrio sp. LC3010 TaxID=1280680 RepID=UPI0004009986|nr:flagellar hook-length control protein FliK [Butyrivibrio sp. LC3010]